MEIIQGSPHVAFAMGDPSCVGEARRHAARLASELGFDATLSGRVALLVTELGSNLVKHATHGRLLIASRSTPGAEIEVLSVDAGPGIHDVTKSMQDGFSTGGTPGTGLGAVKRLSDDFDLHSEPGKGTVVVARVRAQPGSGAARFQVGVAALCAPGERVCGDGWAVAMDGDAAAVLMADGLGHGPEAMKAAQAAVTAFVAQPFRPLVPALEQAHASLRTTRGAAVATVLLDGRASTIRSAGAGNVVTRVVSGTTNRTLLSQNGTVGAQIRRVEEVLSDWPPHALMVLHTDGLTQRWEPAVLRPLLGRDPSLAAAVLLRDQLRGKDDATVLVLRRKDGR